MDSLLNLEKLKKKYKDYNDHNSRLEATWVNFFNDLDNEAIKYLQDNKLEIKKNSLLGSQANTQDNEYTANSLRARLLIRAYRIAGHLKADLDPLNLMEQKYIPDLDPRTYGIEDSDMDKEVFIDGVFGIKTITIRELIKILEKNYCGNIGVQFMHIQDKEQRDWFMGNIENIKTDEIFTD